MNIEHDPRIIYLSCEVFYTFIIHIQTQTTKGVDRAICKGGAKIFIGYHIESPWSGVSDIAYNASVSYICMH